MFTKIFSIACLIFLFAIQASAQSPQVEPVQEADSAAENEETAEQNKEGSEKSPIVPEASPPSEKPDPKQISENTSSQVTTTVSAGGRDTFGLVEILQILVAIALATFTGLLVRYNKRLWKASNEQSKSMGNFVKEANRSAVAMEGVAKNIEDGTNLNQQTFKKQMRGYVCVSVFDTAFQTDHPKSRFGASLKMVNTGFTPAYLKSYKIKAAILNGSLPSENALEDAPETLVAAVLGHQQDLTIAAFVDEQANKEEVEIIKFGEVKALFVWGSLCYADIYEGKRDKHTNFCFKIIWLPNGNPWILHYGKYNTAD